LASDYPGEVSALVRLAPTEAALVLRQSIKETPADDEDTMAGNLAEKLREVLGLTRGDTETVDILPREDSDLFDAVSAAVLQARV
jgi:hypothetical protein